MKLLVLRGDGVGPELAREVLRIADWFTARRGLRLAVEEVEFGLASIARCGAMIEAADVAKLRAADAVFLSALGSAKEYAEVDPALRRGWTALHLRQQLDARNNLRPIGIYPGLDGLSPLRPELAQGLDLLFVRELTRGLYVDEPRGLRTLADGTSEAKNSQAFTSAQIREAARLALTLACRRSGRLTSIDKANVLDTGILWRREVQAVRDAEFPEIELSHAFVDDWGAELVRGPARFDVVLADNMFGDILSDVAAGLSGPLGLLPSASVGAVRPDGTRRGLYEPMHGSAPALAGTGRANPIGAIRTFGMALRYGFGRPQDADLLERAVAAAIAAGHRTPDLAAAPSGTLSTAGMTDAVLEHLEAAPSSGAQPWA